MNSPLYAPPEYDPTQEIELRSSWPKVLGILGIVFGGAALLFGIVGVFGTKMAQQQYESFGITQEILDRHATILTVAPMISTGLGFVLLLGGILLALRKKASRPLIMIWALMKIGYSLWQAPLMMAFQKELLPMQQKMMNRMGNSKEPMPDMAAIMNSVGSVIQIVGVFWLCALPIFMLIWFARAKIAREVAQWG